jgi:WD40 repeat protein
MVFRQDKSVLVSIHEGGILKVWDLHTGKEISHFSVSGIYVLSSDGRLVAAGTDDGKVTLWEVDTWNLLYSFEQINQQVRALAFSPDSNLLVIIYQEQVVFWDLKSDVEPRIYPWNEGYLSKIDLTKDPQDGCFGWSRTE